MMYAFKKMSREQALNLVHMWKLELVYNEDQLQNIVKDLIDGKVTVYQTNQYIDKSLAYRTELKYQEFLKKGGEI